MLPTLTSMRRLRARTSRRICPHSGHSNIQYAPVQLSQVHFHLLYISNTDDTDIRRINPRPLTLSCQSNSYAQLRDFETMRAVAYAHQTHGMDVEQMRDYCEELSICHQQPQSDRTLLRTFCISLTYIRPSRLLNVMYSKTLKQSIRLHSGICPVWG
jgi:hypothetical protein